MQLRSLVEKIGLNAHESRIYLYLLEAGERPASVVASALKLPRSTTRNSLDKLCERGVVQRLYKRNTQYYSCKTPAALTAHMRDRIHEEQSTLKELEQALPMLSALYGRSSTLPKVQYFEGPKGVIEAFNHSLYQGANELLFITSYKFLKNPIIEKNDDDFYIPRRVKNKTNLRVLVGRTERTDKFTLRDEDELRQRRFLPSRFQFPGNFHIYGNFVACFTAGEGEYMAVLIESAPIAATMRALFECLWEKA